jgi:trans-2,3-dihydro-3-hydroxyanthranilate isomerase
MTLESGPRYVIADVFASAPFRGNQLAVFTDCRDLDDEFMQRAANEIGYSETTFVLPPESPEDDYRLRIFTPRRELPFAGHPIVGSAVVAAAEALATKDPGAIRFGTGVGTIEVATEIHDSRSGRAEMRQHVPTVLFESADAADVSTVARALGVSDEQIAVGRSPIAALDNGIAVVIVPLDSLATVRALKPNPVLIGEFSRRFGASTFLAFTTEHEHEDSAAHSRVFAPEAGIYEDAATGSACGPFGVYLVTHGLAPVGTSVNEQGYEMGRPSRLEFTVATSEDGRVSSVRVGGGVFVTGEGRIYR